MELYDHQVQAIKRMHNGCILNGGVGTGKSRTALTYYLFRVLGGSMTINGKSTFKEPQRLVDLYIITTARKRDTKDWESEMVPFPFDPNIDISMIKVKVTIDSWNNISKYANVANAFFIFDEQRVVGKGTWSKSFIKIAKNNEWILLSATPGDKWEDYIPVFIANGFYKNRTEFSREHLIFSRFTKFPKIEKYVNVKKLEHYRDAILVDMEFKKHTITHHENLVVPYDIDIYKSIQRNRWNPYKEAPIQQIAELAYCLRRVVNSSDGRIEQIRKIIKERMRLEMTQPIIVFYNFDYELDILRNIAKEMNVKCSEWNGHKHEPVIQAPYSMYLVQYTAGAEGWNCTYTNTMIFYSQNYSYKTMIQSEGRIDRLNTPFTDLYYYHIRSSAPIDVAIFRALKQKKNFNESRFFKN